MIVVVPLKMMHVVCDAELFVRNFSKQRVQMNRTENQRSAARSIEPTLFWGDLAPTGTPGGLLRASDTHSTAIGTQEAHKQH